MTAPSPITCIMSHKQCGEIADVADALADQCEQVTIALLGQPSSASGRELRFGRRGSFALRRDGAKRGCWYDHERGEGGDMLTLLAREHGVRLGDVVRIALMTTPAEDKPSGIHRTFLNIDGSKRDRKMLGRAGVIRLSRDEAVTGGLGITEGVEDGLAVLLSGWSPIWAAGSAGAIKRFPVLHGIDSLTIFADADSAGLEAAQECETRWASVGKEARISAPARSRHA